MQNKNFSFAIILKRLPNGYQFDHLKKTPLQSRTPTKKGRFVAKKSTTRVPNRLIKEIGLNQLPIPPQIPLKPAQNNQEKTPQPTVPSQPEQETYSNINVPNVIMAEQEEVSCQIDRQDTNQGQTVNKEEIGLPRRVVPWFNRNKVHQKEALFMGFKLEYKTADQCSQKNRDIQLVQNGKTEDQKCVEAQIAPQFAGEATIYKHYRNFIIDAFSQNPKRYLMKISCRKILRGDINFIHKIHNFLQRQGLINYGIGMDGNYSFRSGPLTKQYEQKERPQTCLKSLPSNEHESLPTLPIDTNNMTLTVINKNFSRFFRAHCSECKLVCGIVWYASTSENDTAQRCLCIECFRRVIPAQVAGHFTKVDILKKIDAANNTASNNSNSASNGTGGNSILSSRQHLKTSWSIEDNMKLLDFMGHSEGRPWAELIEQFSGKRTIEDIILQYMQFPISNCDPESELMKAKETRQGDRRRTGNWTKQTIKEENKNESMAEEGKLNRQSSHQYIANPDTVGFGQQDYVQMQFIYTQTSILEGFFRNSQYCKNRDSLTLTDSTTKQLSVALQRQHNQLLPVRDSRQLPNGLELASFSNKCTQSKEEVPTPISPNNILYPIESLIRKMNEQILVRIDHLVAQEKFIDAIYAAQAEWTMKQGASWDCTGRKEERNAIMDLGANGNGNGNGHEDVINEELKTVNMTAANGNVSENLNEIQSKLRNSEKSSDCQQRGTQSNRVVVLVEEIDGTNE